MNITDKFNLLKSSVPAEVRIVAVSKTIPAIVIEELFVKTGHKIFGENKAQELEAKHQLLPAGIDWHFIGHLQTNKIKYIAPYIALIHSVDSYKLLTEINNEAIKCNRIIPCLLQFHIAQEEAKYGFSLDEVKQVFEKRGMQELLNISIQGVMGMATFTSDKHLVRDECKTLYNIFRTLKTTYFSNNSEFVEISMGMTDDYQIAIEEGSTLIRIGSGIFGER